MASIDAEFKTVWSHARKILDLTNSEKEYVLVWLAGYAPDAVKTALDALAKDFASAQNAMQNTPPTNPNPTNLTPPNAPPIR